MTVQVKWQDDSLEYYTLEVLAVQNRAKNKHNSLITRHSTVLNAQDRRFSISNVQPLNIGRVTPITKRTQFRTGAVFLILIERGDRPCAALLVTLQQALKQWVNSTDVA